MKALFPTLGDARDVLSWSGSNRHIALALEQEKIDLDYLALRDPYHAAKRVRRFADLVIGRCGYLPDRSHRSARSYARQIAHRLHETQPDLVLTTGTIPLAFLETDFPAALWADANFAAMLDYYPAYSNVQARSVAAGHEIEQRGLARADLVIYASNWAAETAVEAYGVDPGKVIVIPFGANIDAPTRSEVIGYIDARPDDECRLLFVGAEWNRKGGDIAIEAARALTEAGVRTELVVVGCEPHIGEFPPFVDVKGFVSKATVEGRAEMRRIFARTHFLIHPARAEAYGIVVAEASAFAVPSVVSATGGIPTAVCHGRNGYVLPIDTPAAGYAAVIGKIFADRGRYRILAQSSFNQFEQRLNWATAALAVATRLRRL